MTEFKISNLDRDTADGFVNAKLNLSGGSMTRKQNVQTYPDGYGQPGYEGPTLEAIWKNVEDLSTIERFGFSKADFQGADCCSGYTRINQRGS